MDKPERSAADAIREAAAALENLSADDPFYRAHLTIALLTLADRIDRLYRELGL